MEKARRRLLFAVSTSCVVFTYIDTFHPYNYPMHNFYDYPNLKMKKLGHEAAK